MADQIEADVQFAPANQDKAKTGRSFNTHKDPRGHEKAGKYPDQIVTHTRSGHSIVYDDSKGAESVTIQHRSGSAVQMLPDGALQITAHNSRYDITFGDNRVTISGANDICVKGDASMRVYGDYNVTCHKDYNLTVMGDLNITAKNKNQHIRGNKDTMMKNETKKIEGSSAVMAHGAITRVAKGSITNASIGDQAFVAGSGGVHMAVPGDQGDITMKVHNKGNMKFETSQGDFEGKFAGSSGDEVHMKTDNGNLTFKADKNSNMEAGAGGSSGNFKVKAKQDIGLETTSGGIQAKSLTGDVQVSSGGNVEVSSTQDTHVTAQGHAAMEGSTGTTVGNGTAVTNVVGGAAGINIDPLAGILNLAGGGGSAFGGLGQLSFDFGSILQADGIQAPQAKQATQTNEEQDSSSWTNSLL